MSFTRQIENNIKNVDKDHLPSNLTMEIHGHSNGWKNSHKLVLPPLNRFGGQIRAKPQSGFNQANLLSNSGQLDFQLNSAGYVESLNLEMELTVSNNNTTILPHYLIDRVEFLSTEGNIVSTIYGDCIYTEKLHHSLEYSNRIRTVENFDTSYNGVVIVAGTTKRILLHIPCFVDQCQLKLSVVKSKLLVRVYFSPLGIVGTPSDVSVGLCDIIQNTQQLSGSLESLENKRKSSGPFHFRFLNPVRVASQTLAMTATSQYDIRLTSANNMSAFLFFVIRQAPITSANVNTFLAIDSFELLDSDNTVQGIKITNEYHKKLTLGFDGDILNHKNIYCVPFAVSISSARSGSQTGFYSFSSNEILRIYTPAGFVNQSYRVDVYSYDYNKLTINEGSLMVSK